MIDLNKCEGGQRRDDSGIVMPWYTHPALDEILSWDLSRKRVFEYGVGQSTLWWAGKAEWVYGVDGNPEWVKAMHDQVISNSIIACISIEDIYVASIHNFKNIDIVVVDGDYRDKCVPHALSALKPGGKLIIDNWSQPSVWMPKDETTDLIASLEHTIFPQPDHYDWTTLIATK